MKEIIVTLGKKEYILKPRPIRQAREVRKMIESPFGQAIGALTAVPDQDLSDVQGLGKLALSLKDALLGSMDILLEVLAAFCPEVAADRARIEEEAFDEEVAAAFVEVVKLLYPFGSLVNSVNGFKRQAT